MLDLFSFYKVQKFITTERMAGKDHTPWVCPWLVNKFCCKVSYPFRKFFSKQQAPPPLYFSYLQKK